MSLKIFCPVCGAPSYYALDVPKYCSQCAKPFTSSGAIIQTANAIQKSKSRHPSIKLPNDLNDENNDENNDDFDFRAPSHIPHFDLDKLEVEIDKPYQSGIKIGQLAASLKTEVKDVRVEVPTKKQILADFQKQASAIKRGESSEVT